MKNNERKPEISVVVPVYNVELYLIRCIKSILNQTYKNFEVILVDDGSTDASSKLCDEIKDRDNRVRVLHKLNGGLSDARNKGIHIASGKYITFVDSDDWIAENMLEVLYNLCINYSADIAVCGFEKKDTYDNNVVNSYQSNVIEYSQKQFLEVLLRVRSNRCVHYAWGKLYKKEVLDPVEHFPYGIYNEDVEAMFKSVFRSQKIVEITYPYYFYYYNVNGISHSVFGENFLSLTKVWDRVVQLFEIQKPEMVGYAIYNRERSDFTILVESIMYGNKETDIKYKEEIKNIRSNLWKNLIKLFKGPMVLNRKISAFIIALFYNQIRRIYRVIRH